MQRFSGRLDGLKGSSSFFFAWFKGRRDARGRRSALGQTVMVYDTEGRHGE
jgi:hypothetical protein